MKTFRLLVFAAVLSGCGEDFTSVLSDISMSAPVIVLTVTNGSRNCELVVENVSIWGVLNDESGLSVDDYVTTLRNSRGGEAFELSAAAFNILSRYCTSSVASVDLIAEAGQTEFVQHYFSTPRFFGKPVLDQDVSVDEYYRIAYFMFKFGYVIRTEGIGAVTAAYKISG